MQKRENRGSIGILDHLAGFTLDRRLQNSERILLDVQHIGEKCLLPAHAPLGDTAAYSPEIANGGYIVLSRHNAFERMGQHRFIISYPPFSKGLLSDNGICNILRGSGRDGGFDQHKAFGLDFFSDYAQTIFQRRNFGLPCLTLPRVSF